MQKQYAAHDLIARALGTSAQRFRTLRAMFECPVPGRRVVAAGTKAQHFEVEAILAWLKDVLPSGVSTQQEILIREGSILA